jgi:hypothetical protein
MVFSDYPYNIAGAPEPVDQEYSSQANVNDRMTRSVVLRPCHYITCGKRVL